MGRKVLIVDDIQADRAHLERIVSEAGHQTLLAENGAMAVERATRDQPDLILMDLGMPEMDGWTAAEKIKSDSETRSIPLIAITAHTLPRDRFRALQAGCDGFVTKPIHVESFLEVIARAFEKLNNQSS